MTAIIWKEIRENLKWAVLLMLGVGACLAWNLYLAGSRYASISVLNAVIEGFEGFTLIGATVCASLLGLLQTVPELWRDQWAFLVHRPLTRTRLFFGKVIAGLALYGAVMLLPLLVAAVWAAMPGHIAGPFNWRYVLPGLADVMGGVAFYFAAMLTGIRQARWYGSRALPFALAVVCEICVVGFPEFWAVVLAVSACVAVLMTAAWGSFIASGQYRSQPRIAKAALGVVLTVGVLCVGFIVVAIVARIVENRPVDHWSSSYYVDKEGRVLRVTAWGDDPMIRKVTDLAGNPVPNYEGKPFSEFEKKCVQFHGVGRELEPWIVPGYRRTQRFIRAMNDDRQVTWFFVFSERLVVGYDLKMRLRIGTIGPDGFSPVGATASQTFPPGRLLDDAWWDVSPFLVFSTGVYQVDFNTRQARLLVKVGEDEAVLGAAVARVQDGVKIWGIITSKRIVVFDTSSEVPFTTVYHYPRERYPNVEVAAMPAGGYAIWYSPAYLRPSTSRPPKHVVIVTAAGEEVNRYDLPPIEHPSAAPTWPHALWALVIPIAGLIAWCVGQMIWAWIWFGDPFIFIHLRELRYELFESDESAFLLFAGVVLLVGAVFWASVVFGIARRYAFSRRQTWWWAVGGFILGPAGLLTLLVLREWPARLPCATCGRKRLVDRQQCEHCGAAFPPPAPTGTEIFDEPEGVDAVTGQR